MLGGKGEVCRIGIACSQNLERLGGRSVRRKEPANELDGDIWPEVAFMVFGI